MAEMKAAAVYSCSGTKHGCTSISTRTYTQLGSLQEADVGSVGCWGRCMLSLTTVDRRNRPEPTSVHFTAAWHGGRLGLWRAVCQPPAALWSATASAISGSRLWNKPPWRSKPESCVLTFCNHLIWDFVLIKPASVTRFHCYWALIAHLGLREMCSDKGLAGGVCLLNLNTCYNQVQLDNWTKPQHLKCD